MSVSSIKEEAMTLQPQLVTWRRSFHRCPELKMDTVTTAHEIVRCLKEIGFEEQDIRTGVGGNGVTALICGATPGKCLGLRADCDGLPIAEETGLPFASSNGNMHACGHDAHVAMALGAAKLLLAHRHELVGDVKLIFQPYEEGDGGAKAMLADHVLDDPPVHAIVGQHIGNLAGMQYPAGTVCWCPTISSYAIRTFRVCFHGKGAHVSTPHEGADPLLAACYAVTQLQALLSRETRPGTPAVVSVSMIHSGSRNNVIPDECSIEGTIRSTSKAEQDHYFARIGEICGQVAAAMRCSAQITMIFDLMPTVNHPDMTAQLVQTASRIVSPQQIVRLDQPTPIGEDFARYADRIPAAYYFLSSTFGDNRDHPHHNSRFDVNEAVLWEGAALFAQYALDWQSNSNYTL